MKIYIMKKTLLFLILVTISVNLIAQEEKADSTSTKSVKEKIVKIDGEVFTKSTDRYKLYPTPNTYNFLKLDTRTGIIYRVQWNTESDKRFQTIVNPDNLLRSYDEEINGRYEISLTDNIYNFLLLDKIEGRVWQCQWSFDKEKNMVLRIW